MAADDPAEKTRAMEQCSKDLDLLVDRIINLTLDTNNGPDDGQGAAPPPAPDDHAARLAAATEAEIAAPAPAPAPAAPPPATTGSAEWADRLIRELSGAQHVDEARALAARLLDAFGAAASAAAREERDVALRQSRILKQAFGILHRLHTAQKQAHGELQGQLAACKQRVGRLETDNYALSVHLRRAQRRGRAVVAGRFNPEVF